MRHFCPPSRLPACGCSKFPLPAAAPAKPTAQGDVTPITVDEFDDPARLLEGIASATEALDRYLPAKPE